MLLNIVLVTVDTLRADHVGCYGGSTPTPAIDRLAERGLRFDDATATAPTTLPSHASILSGQWVHVHGVGSNSDTVPDSLELVSDRLADAGYRTAAFVSGHPLSGARGLASHFRTYDDRMPDALGGAGFPPERRASGTVAAASKWLNRAERDEPFFLWVHLYDPHMPYTPTAGAGYDAEIAEVDRAVGALMDRLEAGGLADRTAVVLLADHGEGLGDHGEQSHGLFLYQATVRVPLVVAVPGLAPARRSEPVSTVDVAPTLLGLAGLPEDLPGVDLRTPVTAERPLYSATVHGWERYGWAPLQSIRRGSRKGIDAPTPEVYDLATDPLERANLAGTDRSFVGTFPALPVHGRDRELSLQLLALGYATGEPAPDLAAPDPKDRIRLLPELEAASDALLRGRFADAERLLRPVVTADPTNPAALNDLGMALVRQGKVEEALTVLNRAAQRSPRDPMIWTNLGYAASAASDLEKAREAYATAAELAPTFAAPCLNRAMLEYRVGNVGAASKWVSEALRRDPSLPEARALAARLRRPG